MSYVYIRSEARLWTVGFYSPDGQWHPESDYDSDRDAANRAHWLNGGKPAIDRALGDNATDSEREEWLRTHNSNTGRAL